MAGSRLAAESARASASSFSAPPMPTRCWPPSYATSRTLYCFATSAFAFIHDTASGSADFATRSTSAAGDRRATSAGPGSESGATFIVM